MTPEVVRRRARWWLVAAVGVVVMQASLDLVGIDLLSMPLGLLSVLCVGMSMRHSGWLDGFQEGRRQ